MQWQVGIVKDSVARSLNPRFFTFTYYVMVLARPIPHSILNYEQHRIAWSVNFWDLTTPLYVKIHWFFSLSTRHHGGV